MAKIQTAGTVARQQVSEGNSPPATSQTDTRQRAAAGREHRPGTSSRRRSRWAPAVAVLSMVGGLTSAGALFGDAAAHASAPYSVAYTGGDGTAARSAPTATAKIQPLIVFMDGTGLSIVCQSWSADGSAVGPHGNRIFDQVTYNQRGYSTVWVPDAYVNGTAPVANNFDPTLPRCGSGSSAAAQSAVNYAASFNGQNYENGYCLQFVIEAWAHANVRVPAAASAAAFASAHQAQLRTDGTPPLGAIVLWWGTSANPDGHAAISSGDGGAWSTAERSFTLVHNLSIAARNQTRPYAGWYLPTS